LNGYDSPSLAIPNRAQPRSVARAASAIEERLPAAELLLQRLFPLTGRTPVIGITGSPGSGKSTFTDQLIALLRAQGKTVAVLAVDPSSPFSGGSILGDRIRMQRHHADPGVFIRSVATRGHLGGLSAATSDLALLMDAAGYDVVLIETVGVGQDEIDIARIADATLVLLVPGLGDDVQAIKAGIMEVADLYILNKADQPGIERLEKEVQFVVSLSARPGTWHPPILRCVASEAQGISEVWEKVSEFLANSLGEDRKRRGWELRLRDLFREQMSRVIGTEELEQAAADVMERRSDPYSVVRGWLARHQGSRGTKE
jgi:LAO/AO transport system kinase